MIKLNPFNQIKNLKGRVANQFFAQFIQLKASGQKLKDTIQNEKGAIDVIAVLVFGAIILLAVFAGKAVIDGTFSDFFDKFRTWINSKADEVFS